MTFLTKRKEETEFNAQLTEIKKEEHLKKKNNPECVLIFICVKIVKE